jgi:hypothetical protein
MSEIKSRYELIPVVMKGKLLLMDTKSNSIIGSASAQNKEECMELVQRSIELNRKEDDDNLYLNKIKEL